MIDLENEQLTKTHIDDVITALDIERVSIETDMTGFEKIFEAYEDWLDTPRFSGSSASPNGQGLASGTSTITSIGAHPDGTGLIITAGKGRDNSTKFYGDSTTVLEEIVNYT